MREWSHGETEHTRRPGEARFLLLPMVSLPSTLRDPDPNWGPNRGRTPSRIRTLSHYADNTDKVPNAGSAARCRVFRGYAKRPLELGKLMLYQLSYSRSF